MSRFRMWNKIKIQLAGQQRYVLPEEASSVEKEILLFSQIYGWRLTQRKSNGSNKLIQSVAKILRSDGSPCGFTLIERKEEGRSPKLQVRFNQRTGREIRFSKVIKDGHLLKEEFEGAINKLQKFLNLNAVQTKLLIESWPEFRKRNSEKIEKFWP
ncbi:hypothetical protein R6242_16155 [Iodobacter sp. CM08]|uniref:hypothetical protein n=1 Tax=Iodobacter sp. CM08 TaxID=3085902 RepID=UPI0029810B49|nr:hypothetical protein [Iodobacter sp. CM08]MDW5418100.1 hypothetical protein [Iodobacter sp. CM08]